jgi:hypothetical protein
MADFFANQYSSKKERPKSSNGGEDSGAGYNFYEKMASSYIEK